MKPRNVLIFGAAIGIAACLVSIIWPNALWTVFAFYGGTLLGKGYGIFEAGG